MLIIDSYSKNKRFPLHVGLLIGLITLKFGPGSLYKERTLPPVAGLCGSEYITVTGVEPQGLAPHVTAFWEALSMYTE
jgi:hypothetical protein